MMIRKFRLRSFQSIEQVDMLVPPGEEGVPVKTNPFSLDFYEFRQFGEWGRYKGYET
jgi:hypothetical protein